MPPVIRTSINEVITTQWAAAEFTGAASVPYMAIELPKQEAGFDIFGFEYGIVTDGLNAANIEAVVGHIFIDLPKLTAATIGALFGGGIPPPIHSVAGAQTTFYRPYSRWRISPFDVVEDWNKPIVIPPGSSLTALVGSYWKVASASSVQSYICLRGKPKPYQAPDQDVIV